MHYEMRGFARYTVELFRAMKKLAGDNIELYFVLARPDRVRVSGRSGYHSRGVPGAKRDSMGTGGTAGAIEAKRASMSSMRLRTAGCRTGESASTCSPVMTSSIACRSIADRNIGAGAGVRSMRILSHGTGPISTSPFPSFSKQDICRFYGLSPERVVVIHNAANRAISSAVAGGTDCARARQIWLAGAIFSVSRRLRQTQKCRRTGGSFRTTAEGYSAAGAGGRAQMGIRGRLRENRRAWA